MPMLRLTRSEFDVAVTVSDSGKTGGKLGLHISVVEAGVGKEKASERSQVSRIKFEVPIAFRASHNQPVQ